MESGELVDQAIRFEHANGLPRSQPSDTRSQANAEQRDGQRILIVDDEAAVADLIEAVLVDEGYIVAIARDGIQGILLARDWKPDLVLMDVMLPGVDGTTAIRRLKGDPATADLPIVAMSAGRTIRRQSNELIDADAALSKPFDIEALLAQIEFLLSRRRSEG
ncbi:MAG TPA: response regulator [Thermomicrobiales bacterium]|nr:response regulator [Thermomicrobiales bacterium]